MAKLVLNNVENMEAQTSFIQTLNENFEAIAAAFENTFSRDGTTPNTISANIDANSQRIINLAAPQASTDAARFIDLTEALAIDTAIPALEGNSGKFLTNDGSSINWGSFAGLLPANNLSDLNSVSEARTNLGLGTAALATIGTSGSTVPLLNGTLTWNGTNTFNDTVIFNGDIHLSGTDNHRLTGTFTELTPDSIGFRAAPQNLKNVDYTLVLNDSGKSIVHTSSTPHTWTIPPNSSVAYPLGTVICVINTGSGAVTLARGSGVALRQAGSSTNANITLAQHGVATLYQATTDSWYITGAGIS